MAPLLALAIQCGGVMKVQLLILATSLVLLGYQNCAKQNFSTQASTGIETQSTPKAASTTTVSNSIPTVTAVPSNRVPASVPTVSQQPAAQPPVSMPVTTVSQPSPIPTVSPANPTPTVTPAQIQPVNPPTGQQQTPPTYSAPVAEDWQIYNFQIVYDSKMIAKPATGYSPNPDGTILEAGNRTLLLDGSRIATYAEITGNAALKIEDPEQTSPVKVTVILCNIHAINDCKSINVDPNKLNWSLQAGQNTSILGTQFLCVNTRQSVSEKRGNIDCGGNGVGEFMLMDRDPSLIPSLNLPTRGTLLSYNTRGFAEGNFAVRATIPQGYPGLEKFAGRYGEYTVGIKNRMDIQLSVNTGSLFESYGIPLVTVSELGADGPFDGSTFQSVSCVGSTSNGQSFSLSKRQYENRFDVPATLKNLPFGTGITVDCSATRYDGQTAVAKLIQYK